MPAIARGAAVVHLGDCLDVLRELPDNSVDAVVCDPPYGLGFMGKAWDRPAMLGQVAQSGAGSGPAGMFAPGPGTHSRGYADNDGRAFQAWCEQWAAECLRVLKPGGHLAAFGGTRTYHRMACAVEDAGFEIRDGLTWLYGSGFPKSLDVGKAIDKAGGDPLSFRRFATAYAAAVAASSYTHADVDRALGLAAGGSSCYWAREDHRGGLPPRQHWEQVRELLDLEPSLSRLYDAAEREVIGERTTGRGSGRGDVAFIGDSDNRDVTAPATDAARQWDGWGTALKPASEPIVLARKPLAGTVAANVLTHGTGALNIDACRVDSGDRDAQTYTTVRQNPGASADREGSWRPVSGEGRTFTGSTPAGRWPANVVLSHAPDCGPDDTTPCMPGCPVADLDAQSGILTTNPGTYRRKREDASGERSAYKVDPREGHVTSRGDSGGASRFFPVFRYQAKAPTRERPSYVKADAVGSTGPIAAARCRSCGRQDLSGSRCQCPSPDWTREGGDKVAHPTVKPVALMRWLVRLVCPPGGVVLDPFAGSGTTVEAALLEGFAVIGVEREPDYLPLIEQRVDRALAELTAAAPAAAQAPPSLFEVPA